MVKPRYDTVRFAKIREFQDNEEIIEKSYKIFSSKEEEQHGLSTASSERKKWTLEVEKIYNLFSALGCN